MVTLHVVAKTGNLASSYRATILTGCNFDTVTKHTQVDLGGGGLGHRGGRQTVPTTTKNRSTPTSPPKSPAHNTSRVPWHVFLQGDTCKRALSGSGLHNTNEGGAKQTSSVTKTPPPQRRQANNAQFGYLNRGDARLRTQNSTQSTTFHDNNNRKAPHRLARRRERTLMARAGDEG